MVTSSVTTSPAKPTSHGGGILMICEKNFQINVQFNNGQQTKNYIGA